MPYVTLKLGLSLDGRIASRTGASKWVTGPEARAQGAPPCALSTTRWSWASEPPRGRSASHRPRRAGPEPPAHHLRYEAPLAACRPARAVRPRSPDLGRLHHRRSVRRPKISSSTRASRSFRRRRRQRGASTPSRRCGSWRPAEIVAVMIEGGAELAGSVLAGAVVDELHCFIAPILLSPRGRPGPSNEPARPHQRKPRASSIWWEVCGVDALVWGSLGYPAEPILAPLDASAR